MSPNFLTLVHVVDPMISLHEARQQSFREFLNFHDGWQSQIKSKHISQKSISFFNRKKQFLRLYTTGEA